MAINDGYKLHALMQNFATRLGTSNVLIKTYKERPAPKYTSICTKTFHKLLASICCRGLEQKLFKGAGVRKARNHCHSDNHTTNRLAY